MKKNLFWFSRTKNRKNPSSLLVSDSYNVSELEAISSFLKNFVKKIMHQTNIRVYLKVKIMKALEDDADYKLKTLKENDNELKDIDAIKTKLKVQYGHRLILSKFYILSKNFRGILFFVFFMFTKIIFKINFFNIKEKWDSFFILKCKIKVGFNISDISFVQQTVI